MNVIIANKYKDMLMQLDIDVIKSIEGVYDAEEISDMFQNFFFQSMILDITAIKDYKNINNLQKLSMGLDMDKIIFVLDDSPESTSSEYLSKLISLGIYNFTRNKEGIKYLLQHPNSYRDVADLHQLSASVTPKSEETNKHNKKKKEKKKVKKLKEEKKVETPIVEDEEPEINMSMDPEETGELPKVETPIIEEEKHKSFLPEVEEKDTYDMSPQNLMENDMSSSQIIGIKNVTEHAGATSLIYMIKEQLKDKYNVVGIEVDKVDFTFFKDSELITTSKTELSNEILKQKDADIILIDLNEFNNLDICTDVLYLIEPSTLRLNKLMLRSRDIFEKLKGKKIILNKSLLSDKDVNEFEYEAKTKVFFNLPPIDDKELPNDKLDEFIKKLGFIR